MKEIWKPVVGYEGHYQVSNFGRVKSIKFGKEIILKQNIRRGYYYVCLSKNGIAKNYFVHRLVAQAFLPNPDNLPQVNHKDEDKTNNNVTNLEWCTKEENQNHAVRTNLMQHGEDRPSAKLKESDVLEIYKLKGIMKASDIANKYGVSKNTINCILRGSKWKYLYKQYFKCETI